MAIASSLVGWLRLVVLRFQFHALEACTGSEFGSLTQAARHQSRLSLTASCVINLTPFRRSHQFVASVPGGQTSAGGPLDSPVSPHLRSGGQFLCNLTSLMGPSEVIIFTPFCFSCC